MEHNNELGSSFEEDLSDDEPFFDLSRRESVESDSGDEDVIASIQKSKETHLNIDSKGPTARKPLGHRATVIQEADEDDEDDSFELKRELEKQKKFQQYEK